MRALLRMECGGVEPFLKMALSPHVVRYLEGEIDELDAAHIPEWPLDRAVGEGVPGEIVGLLRDPSLASLFPAAAPVFDSLEGTRVEVVPTDLPGAAEGVLVRVGDLFYLVETSGVGERSYARLGDALEALRLRENLARAGVRIDVIAYPTEFPPVPNPPISGRHARLMFSCLGGEGDSYACSLRGLGVVR